MSDTEDSVVEDEPDVIEDDIEAETKPIDLRSLLKNHLLSLARQLFCYCSVMLFPVLAMTIHHLPVKSPYIEVKNMESPWIDERKNFMKYRADYTVSSTIGYFIGGILLYLIGRTYTVLAVNLSYLMILSYINLNGMKSLTYGLKISCYGLQYAALTTYLIYIAEIASPTYRIFYMGLYQLSTSLVSRYIPSQYKKNSHLMLLYGLITALLSSSLSIFAPETPFWLTLKNDSEKAEQTFSWLRAGDSNTAEFNQMLTRAENIVENGIMRYLFAETVAVGVTFSVFIVICSYDPCDFLLIVMHDFYYPSDHFPTDQEQSNMSAILTEVLMFKTLYSTYGQIMFLVFNFIVPRKVLYLISFILGIFTAAPIALKLASIGIVTTIASYCNLFSYLGTKQLTKILPVEVYPAALRELGATFTSILAVVYDYIVSSSYDKPKEAFPAKWIYPFFSWFNFYMSLLGVTFILIFIPETKDMSIFELDELKFQPLIRNQMKGTVDEDAEVDEMDVEEVIP